MSLRYWERICETEVIVVTDAAALPFVRDDLVHLDPHTKDDVFRRNCCITAASATARQCLAGFAVSQLESRRGLWCSSKETMQAIQTISSEVFLG